MEADLLAGLCILCCFDMAISALIPTSTFAGNNIDDEARSVTAGCHEALKDKAQTFEAGMCLGILKGLLYLSNDICIPPGTSLGRMADIVAQYLDCHAGKVDDDFQKAGLEAMRYAWPCGRRNNI